MSSENLLKTIPFPFRIQSRTTFALKLSSQGVLFDEPNYGRLNDSFWKTVKSEGWHSCSAGYGVYVKKIPGESDDLLIVHGLKVRPFWTQRGKTKGVSIVLDMPTVENYIKKVIDGMVLVNRDIDRKARELVTENVHEIRSLNGSLYHVGFELQQQLQYDQENLPLARNVVALSELISARIQLADLTTFISGQSIVGGTVPIPAYKKFDKIVKCFIAYAAKRKIVFELKGGFKGQIRGIEQFEMIPLILIDNAVKYSPDGGTIIVEFSEFSDRVSVDVISMGPLIENHEKSKIFERGVRGQNAIKSGKSGSGIGLYFAKQLMDQMSALILIEQDINALFSQNSKKFYKTTVSLSFSKI